MVFLVTTGGNAHDPSWALANRLTDDFIEAATAGPEPFPGCNEYLVRASDVYHLGLDDLVSESPQLRDGVVLLLRRGAEAFMARVDSDELREHFAGLLRLLASWNGDSDHA